jgi:hypothetical protein
MGVAAVPRGRRRARRRDRAETYRFGHLEYGVVAYFDQPVFKRHQVIPPRDQPSELRLAGTA